jgi:GNAT superfamily N-acetyltransferase
MTLIFIMRGNLLCPAVTTTIRDAVPGDLDDILDMIRGLAEFERMADHVVFVPASMREHLFGDDRAATVTIAEVDGATAGMALWFRTFSTFLGRPGIWLEDLFVRPEHRSQGVGAALLGHLRGLTDGRLEWSVLDWNRSAIEFYERLGARPDDGGWIMYRWAAP